MKQKTDISDNNNTKITGKAEATSKSIPAYILIPVILISLSLSLPLLYLLIRISAADISFYSLLLREQTITALRNTILLAVSVTFSSILIAVPLGWLTVRTDLPGKNMLGILSMVPLVIPSLIAANDPYTS